jgi:hypothetical protein
LANKVSSDELLQVKESLNRKLDIATFLESKNEMNSLTRSLEKDIRDLSQSVRQITGISSNPGKPITKDLRSLLSGDPKNERITNLMNSIGEKKDLNSSTSSKRDSVKKPEASEPTNL